MRPSFFGRMLFGAFSYVLIAPNYCGVSAGTDPLGPSYSFSMDQAKKRGTFVCQIEIVPKKMSVHGTEFCFGPAWLEKLQDGRYALCFLLEQGTDAFWVVPYPYFVLGDRGSSFKMHCWSKRILCVDFVGTAEVSALRASLLTGSKEDRPKNIKFVPKAK
jgi:hypothetical protein